MLPQSRVGCSMPVRYVLGKLVVYIRTLLSRHTPVESFRINKARAGKPTVLPSESRARLNQFSGLLISKSSLSNTFKSTNLRESLQVSAEQIIYRALRAL